jgi:hypothetical protein
MAIIVHVSNGIGTLRKVLYLGSYTTYMPRKANKITKLAIRKENPYDDKHV